MLLFQLFDIQFKKFIVSSFEVESRFVVVSSPYAVILEQQKLFFKFNQSLINLTWISLKKQLLYLFALEIDKVHSDIKLIGDFIFAESMCEDSPAQRLARLKYANNWAFSNSC